MRNLQNKFGSELTKIVDLKNNYSQSAPTKPTQNIYENVEIIEEKSTKTL